MKATLAMFIAIPTWALAIVAIAVILLVWWLATREKETYWPTSRRRFSD